MSGHVRYIISVPANTVDLDEGDFVEVACLFWSEDQAMDLDTHNFQPLHGVFDEIVKSRLGANWEASIEDRFDIIDTPDANAKIDVDCSDFIRS